MLRIIRVATIAFVSSSVLFSLNDDVRAEDFHGYDCTQDCSGHQAGYDWAEQKGIGDASDCGGNSQSFVEGCEAYANENSGAAASPSQDETSDDDAQSNDGDGTDNGQSNENGDTGSE